MTTTPTTIRDSILDILTPALPIPDPDVLPVLGAEDLVRELGMIGIKVTDREIMRIVIGMVKLDVLEVVELSGCRFGYRVATK